MRLHIMETIMKESCDNNIVDLVITLNNNILYLNTFLNEELIIIKDKLRILVDNYKDKTDIIIPKINLETEIDESRTEEIDIYSRVIPEIKIGKQINYYFKDI